MRDSSKLFSAMIKLAHVSVEMKKGTIITVCQGGNKRRDDYRQLLGNYVVFCYP